MPEYHEDNEEDWEIQGWTPPPAPSHRVREASRSVAQFIVVGAAGVITMMLTVIFLQVWGVGLLPAALVGSVLTVAVVIGMIKATDRI